jgi:hypothetical protein
MLYNFINKFVYFIILNYFVASCSVIEKRLLPMLQLFKHKKGRHSFDVKMEKRDTVAQT